MIKKTHIRIVLASILLICLIQLSLRASQNPIREEILSLRGENIKQFMEPSGQVRAEVYTQAVHFKNEKDEWEDIDTTLTDNSNPAMLRHKTRIFKTANETKQYTSMTDAGIQIDFQGKKRIDFDRFEYGSLKNNHAVLASKNGQVAMCLDDERFVVFWPTKQALRTNIDRNKMQYRNDENLIFEETVLVNGVKENIILSSSSVPDSADFHMEISGLRPELRENAIVFLDNNDQIVLRMLEPYMYDAQGEESADVHYQLKETGPGRYLFTISWSREWVCDEKRVFPVTACIPACLYQ